MRSRQICWGFSLAILVGAFLASTGFFVLDEVIYSISADAFREHGSLIIQNGYDLFHSQGLKLWLLRAGPHGLAPQYPPGPAVVGGLLEPLLGARALIVLNALSSVASMFLVRALARTWFGQEEVAVRAVLIFGLAGFLAEYALGFWPHAISVFWVLAALLAAWKAIMREDGPALGWAILSGLCVGLGMLFRLDVVLVLLIAGAAAILYASKPIRVIAGGALGVLPGLIVLSLSNHFKFGTFNPLSYGADTGLESEPTGNIAPSQHYAAAVLILLCCGLLAVWRLNAARGRPLGRSLLAGLLAAVLALALAWPATRAVLAHYVQGFHALVLDATALTDTRPVLEPGPAGTLKVFGMPKKALAQSLPWMGLLFFLVFARWRSEDRRPLIFMLLGVAIWTLPFILLNWHGGFGGNMRYFLPIVPLLALMAARVWGDLLETAREGGRTARFEAIGIRGAVAIFFVWVGWGPGGMFGAHQLLPKYLFAATAVASLLAGYPGGYRVRWAQAAVALGWGGFILAAVLGASDLSNAQWQRMVRWHSSQSFSTLSSSPSLVLAEPEVVMAQVRSPADLVALPNELGGPVDVALLVDALNKGYRVFVQDIFLLQVLEADGRLQDAGIRAVANDSALGTKMHELVLRQ